MLDLKKNEESILEYWNGKRTHEKINDLNKNGKRFYFLEGPPYTNGELHMGHVRGYARKDAILRYKRMRGFWTYDKAGFDVHGLPIENKVERDLEIKSKKEIETTIGVRNFIKACMETYQNYLSKQIEIAKRYGVWFDFENTYIPATPEYIDRALSVFKKMYDKGLVYKDIKVMPYCLHCGTVLAKGPEVEEEFDTDPSVYVTFKVNKKLSKAKIQLSEETKLLVWTTTPWTLPGNVLICVNPNAEYVRAKINNNELVIAKERLDAVAEQLKASPVILQEFSGAELEGIRYISPLEEFVPIQKETRKSHRVVLSEELVTMTDGTGLVHIAPAFGPEDFAIGKKEKAPVLSIVGLDGLYNDQAGKYVGIKLIHDANHTVEHDLQSLGAMLLKSQIRHSYPHCWRCHEKLVYLPTEQWFIRTTKLRNKIRKASEKVKWYPKELKAWFIESAETAPDWVISRQRYWGIPIPIWTCESCKSIRVLGSYDDIKTTSNGKIRFLSEDLHRPVIDELVLNCEKCNGKMTRIKDVFDVWYDSGVAHTASVDREIFDEMYGKAFITEGPDQIRGWFATLMRTGIAAYGKSPFDTVLMQGWVVDSKGEAMHKSKGNYVSAVDALGKYSVDAVRAFTLSHGVSENLKFSHVEIEEMQGMIMMLHNISNLVLEYSNAVDYVPKEIKKPKVSDPEDLWIVSRLNSVILKVTEGFENYDISMSVNEAKDFIVNDFSRFYLKIAKKKMSSDKKAVARRTIDLVNYLMYNVLLLISPIAPMNTEKVYLENYEGESIFMNRWPKSNGAQINQAVEEDFKVAFSAVTALLNSREKVGVRLRWPLSKGTVEVSHDGSYRSLERLGQLIADYANLKKVEIKLTQGIEREIRPLYKDIGPEFKENAGVVAEALKTANPDDLLDSISKTGFYVLHTNNGTFEVKPKHFMIIDKVTKENAATFKGGIAYVDKEISKELFEEAMLREFERIVQLARREAGFKKRDRINLAFLANIEISNIVKDKLKILKKNVSAKTVAFEIKETNSGKEYEIEGNKVSIFVEKAA